MAKPSAGLLTPRPSAFRPPSSCPTTRSSVGSTSSSSANAAASKLPAPAANPREFASNAKVVAKCLAYDDDDITLAAAAAAQEDDLGPLLDLPDPDVSVDTSAAPDDALTASSDSCVTEVPALADSIIDSEAPLPVEFSVVLAELHGASGLSPRSKRLLAALTEAAAFELAPSATARRLRRAAFWGKVRVAVLAGTLAAVVAVDMALAAYLYARRANDRYHVLPPT
ncbi:hypothetical protein PAHAL_1G455100 [Panicum hallii]|uniref:Uncharacterized protein n=1 Tax=Panicum hallii TaxID=206008 RepID=A0A2S3GUR1_9POAL|nr:uncharacterized protein LOC112880566 [Panicum hallii]PAN09051.1 hypothetical protein PAHAL_1G455100 [Panicum hallii]